MKNPSSEQRLNQYLTLSQEMRDFYASADNQKALREMFASFHLQESSYLAYDDVFGDTILGFIKPEDMSIALVERTGLPEGVAVLIAKEFEKFLPESIKKPIQPALISPAVKEPATEQGAQKYAPPIVATEQVAPAPAKAAEPEDRPFYPRVPDYSKPFTEPVQKREPVPPPQPAPPIQQSPARVGWQAGSDPYREPPK